jgi:hypothetical protein
MTHYDDEILSPFFVSSFLEDAAIKNLDGDAIEVNDLKL